MTLLLQLATTFCDDLIRDVDLVLADDPELRRRRAHCEQRAAVWGRELRVLKNS